MYLVDSNIWLERLLSQGVKDEMWMKLRGTIFRDSDFSSKGIAVLSPLQATADFQKTILKT